MNFSLKSIRFVIEALEHYRRAHDERIQLGGQSEDELADLINDRQYLEAIQQDCEDLRDQLIEQAAATQTAAGASIH